jgi:hypothetical protein
MDIISRLKSEQWFVVSACKGKQTDKQNTARLQLLLYWAMVNAEVYEAQGMWDGQIEQSFLVFGDITAAESFGKMFDQTHVLTSVGLFGLQAPEFSRLVDIKTSIDESAPYTVLADGTKFQALLAA